MRYITPQGARNVKTYKYVGIDKSLVANHVMQPFWRWLVNYLPLWLAPNTVTLIGFVFIILSYLNTAYYHPNVAGAAPSWVYASSAVFMFIYQTMDALDGKQARRTNSSSPLGELFDHGCDAVTTVLGVLTLACTLQTSHTLLLLCAVMLLSAFYLTQWEEYFTGSLVLGYIGVTEAQIVSILIYAMAAIRGPHFWLQTLELGGYQISYGTATIYFTLLSSFATILSNFVEIWHHCSATKRGGKTAVSFAEAVTGALPLIGLSTSFVIWAYFSPGDVFGQHPHIFIVTYGFLVSNLVGRVVLARVCGEPFPSGIIFLLPLLLVLVSIATKGALFREDLLLVLYCVFAVGSYLHFARGVIVELCAALRIRCFHIKQQPAK